MEINVRKATFEDYNPLCELFDEVDALHRDHLPHLFQKPDGPVREQDYFFELIAEENIGLFVAEADQKLVGFIHAEVIETPAFPIIVPRRYATVNNFVVKAGYQNQGIGKRLMEKMQSWAIANGASSLELTVYEFNETAFSFYEKIGYQTVSRKMSKDLKRGKISLRPVNADNWRDIIHLKVSETQRKFVTEPAYYLALCSYGNNWQPLAIYLDEQVIGFMMWTTDPADGSCWLGGILIDQSKQNRGYGKQAVQAAITMLNEKYGYKNFALSYQPTNLSAKQLYNKLGFIEMDEWENDEIVARLSLPE